MPILCSQGSGPEPEVGLHSLKGRAVSCSDLVATVSDCQCAFCLSSHCPERWTWYMAKYPLLVGEPTKDSIMNTQ